MRYVTRDGNADEADNADFHGFFDSKYRYFMKMQKPTPQ